MPILLVVNNPAQWHFEIPGVEIVSARSYLTDSAYSEMRGAKVFNLCRSYAYQNTGYYVSLLAMARGHKPQPSIITIQDLKSQSIIRVISDDLDELIQKNLASIKSQRFDLSIYFGRNMAHKYERLCAHLYSLFQAPLLRAVFSRSNDRWQLQNINAISTNEIPDSHRDFVREAATAYFAGRRVYRRKRTVPRYDLAILFDGNEEDSPSNEKAIQKFIKAAGKQGMGAEIITKGDYGRLAEFDALFIRDTTYVNHYTFRFARRAEAEGLVVIDDPESIVRCTNKVYLAEVLNRYKVPIPRTLIVHRDNVDMVATEIGFPCILKLPDSSFSQGVIKVNDGTELEEALKKFLDESDLVIAQAYTPTTYDWRIGIIDRKPIYACKYYMARKHWQIIHRDARGQSNYGKHETVPVEIAPAKIVKTALKAANLIGDGLYGVDLKEHEGKVYVIEVNDNPSIDSGVEDATMKDELYARIMESFLRRIERRKGEYS